MEEQNNNGMIEEVKPVEVQTVDVDQVVGQTAESNTNNSNNQNRGRSPRELILVVIAALTMIASGLYFAFFYDDEETDSSDQEIVETQEAKKETTTEDTTTKEEDKKDSVSETQNKTISSDSDLTESYLKVNTKDDLGSASKKIANLFSNSGLKTGKVEALDKKEITYVTLLYLEGKNNTCFSKNYFKEKVKELFGVEISDGDFTEKEIQVNDSYYCTTEYFSGVGGPAPEFDVKSNSSEKDGNIIYEYEYSYENNKTTISLEYKHDKDHYVLISVDKK